MRALPLGVTRGKYFFAPFVLNLLNLGHARMNPIPRAALLLLVVSLATAEAASAALLQAAEECPPAQPRSVRGTVVRRRWIRPRSWITGRSRHW